MNNDKFVRIITAILSLIIIFYLIRTLNYNSLMKAVSNANLQLIATALAIALISLVLRNLRWWILLREKKEIDFFKLFKIQAVGLSVSSLSPGKILEPAKIIPLKKEGIGYGFGLFTIFWERALDLLVLFSFATLVLYRFDKIDGYFFVIVFAVLLGTIMIMYRNFNSMVKLFSKIPKLSFLNKIETHNFSKITLIVTFIIAVIVWANDSAAIYFVLLAFGIKIKYLTVISAWSASVLIGVVSFLPSGLGSSEASMIYLLSSSTIPLSALIASLLVIRIILNGPVLLFGAYWMPKINKYI